MWVVKEGMGSLLEGFLMQYPFDDDLEASARHRQVRLYGGVERERFITGRKN